MVFFFLTIVKWFCLWVGLTVLPFLFDRWLVDSNFARILIGGDYFYSTVGKTDVEIFHLKKYTN